MTRVFRYRVHHWLVDLDDLPSQPRLLRPLAGFHAADHLGSADRSIRENLVSWLARHDVDLGGGRVLMLTTPRVLGYAFNPLTVYWCHRDDGSLACTVAEVCNTYGGRHCYLLAAGSSAGRSDWYEARKAFYVSPFLPTSGQYRLRLPPPGERISLTITLVNGERTLFTAVLSARRCPAVAREILRLAVLQPLTPHRIRALIQLQGLLLWHSHLPITPGRPA